MSRMWENVAYSTKRLCKSENRIWSSKNKTETQTEKHTLLVNTKCESQKRQATKLKYNWKEEKAKRLSLCDMICHMPIFSRRLKNKNTKEKKKIWNPKKGTKLKKGRKGDKA